MTRINGPVIAFADVTAAATDGSYVLGPTARKDLKAHFGSFKAAADAAESIFAALVSNDYDHSVRLPNPRADCDVYGITTTTHASALAEPPIETPWYIKFYDDVRTTAPYDSFLQVVSFHEDRNNPGLNAKRKVQYP